MKQQPRMDIEGRQSKTMFIFSRRWTPMNADVFIQKPEPRYFAADESRSNVRLPGVSRTINH
jgi:hypothetical protein